MKLGSAVSCICEVVCAFLRGVGVEELADSRDEGFDGSCSRLAQEMLELCKDLLDRVQIGRIFWQQDKLCSGRTDRLSNSGAPVAAEIVHDHQVARLERGEERFFDV